MTNSSHTFLPPRKVANLPYAIGLVRLRLIYKSLSAAVVVSTFDSGLTVPSLAYVHGKSP